VQQLSTFTKAFTTLMFGAAACAVGLSGAVFLSATPGCVSCNSGPACNTVFVAERMDVDGDARVFDGAVVHYDLLDGGTSVQTGALSCQLQTSPFDVEVVFCNDASTPGDSITTVFVSRYTEPGQDPEIDAYASFDEGYPNELRLEFSDGAVALVTIEWGPNDDENCNQPCSTTYTATVSTPEG
jgi:hypothetical protein